MLWQYQELESSAFSRVLVSAQHGCSVVEQLTWGSVSGDFLSCTANVSKMGIKDLSPVVALIMSFSGHRLSVRDGILFLTVVPRCCVTKSAITVFQQKTV